MTIKDAITQEMTRLGKEGTIFIGYNLKFGHKGFGTLTGVDPEQIVETPVNEGLMIGMAMGMALQGQKVMVVLERHDFMFAALDGIVNHLDKMFYDLPVGVRMVVGTKEPLDAGEQHTQDHTKGLRHLLNGLVIKEDEYDDYTFGEATIFIEHKADYTKEVGT